MSETNTLSSTFKTAAASANVSDLRRAILSHLADRADPNGKVEGVSTYSLAAVTNSSAPAVHKALKGLALAGWLTIERSGYGTGRANSYRIHAPEVSYA